MNGREQNLSLYNAFKSVERKYDDMLDMPHHQSHKRAHMSLHDRAAQFAPFQALTGYEEELTETARLTEERITLDENRIAAINEKLTYLGAHLAEHLRISITYFRPDGKKEGGSYLTDVGSIRKMKEAERIVIMESGMEIPMEQIVELQLIEA